MKINKRKLLKITIPIVCVLLVIGALWGAGRYAFTEGRFMLQARHTPENKEPLEIDFVFDKPDEIVYYSNPIFGKKLTDEQRDAVWEAFQRMMECSREDLKLVMKGFRGTNAIFKSSIRDDCLEFRYEQRRACNSVKAFDGRTTESPYRPKEYDGLLIYLDDDSKSFYSIINYVDRRRPENVGWSNYGLPGEAKKEFARVVQEVLEE